MNSSFNMKLNETEKKHISLLQKITIVTKKLKTFMKSCKNFYLLIKLRNTMCPLKFNFWTHTYHSFPIIKMPYQITMVKGLTKIYCTQNHDRTENGQKTCLQILLVLRRETPIDNTNRKKITKELELIQYKVGLLTVLLF